MLSHNMLETKPLVNNIEYLSDSEASFTRRAEEPTIDPEEEELRENLELILSLKSFICFKRFLKNIKKRPSNIVKLILSNEQILEKLLNLLENLSYSEVGTGMVRGMNNEEMNTLVNLITTSKLLLPLYPNVAYFETKDYSAEKVQRDKIHMVANLGLYHEVINIYKINKFNRNNYVEHGRNLPINYHRDGTLKIWESKALLNELVAVLQNEFVSCFDVLNYLCNYALENNCPVLNKLVQNHLQKGLSKLMAKYRSIANYVGYCAQTEIEIDFNFYAVLLVKILENLTNLHYLSNLYKWEHYQLYSVTFRNCPIDGSGLVRPSLVRRLAIMQNLLLALYALNNKDNTEVTERISSESESAVERSRRSLEIVRLLLTKNNKVRTREVALLLNWVNNVVNNNRDFSQNIVKLVSINVMRNIYGTNPGSFSRFSSEEVNRSYSEITELVSDEEALMWDSEDGPKESYVNLYIIRNGVFESMLETLFASHSWLLPLYILNNYVLHNFNSHKKWDQKFCEGGQGDRLEGVQHFQNEPSEEIYNYVLRMLLVEREKEGNVLTKLVKVLVKGNTGSREHAPEPNLVYNVLSLFSKLAKLNPEFYVLLSLSYRKMHYQRHFDELLLSLHKSVSHEYSLSLLVLDIWRYQLSDQREAVTTKFKVSKLGLKREELDWQLLSAFKLNLSRLSDPSDLGSYLSFYNRLFLKVIRERPGRKLLKLMSQKLIYYYKFLMFELNNYVKTQPNIPLFLILFKNLFLILRLALLLANRDHSPKGDGSNNTDNKDDNEKKDTDTENDNYNTDSYNINNNNNDYDKDNYDNNNKVKDKNDDEEDEKLLLLNMVTLFMNNNVFMDLVNVLVCQKLNKESEPVVLNRFSNLLSLLNIYSDSFTNYSNPSYNYDFSAHQLSVGGGESGECGVGLGDDENVESLNVFISLLELVLRVVLDNEELLVLFVNNFENILYCKSVNSNTTLYSFFDDNEGESLNLLESLKSLSHNYPQCLNVLLVLNEIYYNHYRLNLIREYRQILEQKRPCLRHHGCILTNSNLIRKEDMLEYLIVLDSYRGSLTTNRLITNVVINNYYDYYVIDLNFKNNNDYLNNSNNGSNKNSYTSKNLSISDKAFVKSCYVSTKANGYKDARGGVRVGTSEDEEEEEEDKLSKRRKLLVMYYSREYDEVVSKYVEIGLIRFLNESETSVESLIKLYYLLKISTPTHFEYLVKVLNKFLNNLNNSINDNFNFNSPINVGTKYKDYKTPKNTSEEPVDDSRDVINLYLNVLNMMLEKLLGYYLYNLKYFGVLEQRHTRRESEESAKHRNRVALDFLEREGRSSPKDLLIKLSTYFFFLFFNHLNDRPNDFLKYLRGKIAFTRNFNSLLKLLEEHKMGVRLSESVRSVMLSKLQLLLFTLSEQPEGSFEGRELEQIELYLENLYKIFNKVFGSECELIELPDENNSDIVYSVLLLLIHNLRNGTFRTTLNNLLLCCNFYDYLNNLTNTTTNYNSYNREGLGYDIKSDDIITDEEEVLGPFESPNNPNTSKRVTNVNTRRLRKSSFAKGHEKIYGELNELLLNSYRKFKNEEVGRDKEEENKFMAKVQEPKKKNELAFLRLFKCLFVLNKNRKSPPNYNDLFSSHDLKLMRVSEYLRDYEGHHKIRGYEDLTFLFRFLNLLVESSCTKNTSEDTDLHLFYFLKLLNVFKHYVNSNFQIISTNELSLGTGAVNTGASTYVSNNRYYTANASQDSNYINVNVTKDVLVDLDRDGRPSVIGDNRLLIIDDNRIVKNHKYELYLHFLNVFNVSGKLLRDQPIGNVGKLAKLVLNNLFSRISWIFANYNSFSITNCINTNYINDTDEGTNSGLSTAENYINVDESTKSHSHSLSTTHNVGSSSGGYANSAYNSNELSRAERRNFWENVKAEIRNKLKECYLDEIFLYIKLFNLLDGESLQGAYRLTLEFVQGLNNMQDFGVRQVCRVYGILGNFVNLLYKCDFSPLNLLQLINHVKLLVLSNQRLAVAEQSDCMDRLVNSLFEKLLLLFLYTDNHSQHDHVEVASIYKELINYGLIDNYLLKLLN